MQKLNFYTKLLLVIFISIVTTSTTAASNWTRSSGGLYYTPSFKKLRGNDVASFKVNIVDKNPYATTGIFLKKGQYNPTKNSLVAYTENNIAVPLQFDVQNRYNDGSVRFAILTVQKPDNIQNNFEVILKKDRKFIQNGTVKPLRPDIKIIITMPNGNKKTISLKDAKSEAQAWRNGSLVDIRRYFASISKELMVEFDITTYGNGMARSDVVMRYDRIYETPMRSIGYNAEIFVNNKSFKKLENIRQNHHSKFRLPIRFGFSKDNITALNIHKLIDTRALARYDITFGVDQDAIDDDYDRLKNANNSIRGNSLINPAFGTTGARDEIALLPQWAVRYLLTSHDKARQVTLQQGETAAYIPWHFIDSKTHKIPLPDTHPKLRIDYRATVQKNGIGPYNSKDTGWSIDIAHQPSLSYIPYVITGDRYYYDNLLAAYTWTRFSIINENYGILRDPNLRTQNFAQTRGYGWLQRLTAETALVTPENTKLSRHLEKQMKADVNYFQKGHIQGIEYGGGKYGNPTGELYGMLHGWGADTGRENPLFMQNLAAIAMAFHANSGMNDGMRSISAFHTNFISGLFLQKNNGFPPQYGSAYKMLQFTPSKNGIKTKMGTVKIAQSWSDVFKYSTESGFFNKATQEINQKGITGYPEKPDLFVAYARAAQAMMYNTTKDPQALEAYGFLAQYLPNAKDGYHEKPAYLIVPEIGNGYIPYKRTLVGGIGQDNMVANKAFSLLHGQDGDDYLFLDRFTGVLFGGNGNDTLNSGNSNSFLFGGSGNDVLISGPQDDYLKGDENYGRNPDIFVFTEQDFGNDIIADFTPGIDKIKLTQETGILRFYHENKLYGLRRNLKDNPIEYRKIMFPDLSEDLTQEERIKEINRLLAAASRGDIKAKKQLNIVPQVNIGVKNYMRPDGKGGTYINFNLNRTPQENKIIRENLVDKPFGLIHILNVPMEKLRAEDFIFSD